MCRKNIFFGLLTIMLTMNSATLTSEKPSTKYDFTSNPKLFFVVLRNQIHQSISSVQCSQNPHYLKMIISRFESGTEACTCTSEWSCYSCRKYSAAKNNLNSLISRRSPSGISPYKHRKQREVMYAELLGAELKAEALKQREVMYAELVGAELKA